MNGNRHWARGVAVTLGIVASYGFWKAEPSSQNSSFVAHFLHAILFGWMKFAQRVFPEVNVTFASVAFALLVAVITWMLLCVLGKRWCGWNWRLPLVLVCAPALVFVIVLASAGIQERVTEIAPNLTLHTHFRRFGPSPQEIFKANLAQPEPNERAAQ